MAHARVAGSGINVKKSPLPAMPTAQIMNDLNDDLKLYMIETTVGSEQEAFSIAQKLVEGGQCACVSIIPLSASVYRFDGEVVSEREWLLRIKTTPQKAAATTARLKAVHSYQVPEIIGYQAHIHHRPYSDWLYEKT